jgi:membrane protein implicated in regulation of membrane protease activity
MPAHRVLTVVLMVLLAITVVELMAPGAGMSWFGGSFAPSGWTHSERVTYLATELVPVLVFIGIGVAFWVLGRPTRAAVLAARPERPGP